MNGWICPKCGKVNAPWKGTCDCVQVQPNPYTYYYPQPWYPYKTNVAPWEQPYKVTCNTPDDGRAWGGLPGHAIS